MLKAKEMGISPEQLIDQVRAEHEQDFRRFPDRFRPLPLYTLGRKSLLQRADL
jgi:hypothetical protein